MIGENIKKTQRNQKSDTGKACMVITCYKTGGFQLGKKAGVRAETDLYILCFSVKIMCNEIRDGTG